MKSLPALRGPSDAELVAQRKANRRLGLILASVAVLFFVGFMAKMMMLGR